MPAKQTESFALTIPPGSTTTVVGPDLVNVSCRGVKVVLDVTVNAGGAGSVTVFIEGKDKASGKYWTLLAGAAVVTVVTNVYTVYPGIVAAANVAANDVLPEIYRVRVVANNANPITGTCGIYTLV